MKLIPLTQGKFAMVDDEDYDYLMQWKWYAAKGLNNYYAQRGCWNSELKKAYGIKLHRLIMGISNPKTIIDHIDHNGLNCQKHNLRICSHVENMRNRKSYLNSTSKYVGVSWSKIHNKWKAQIKILNKQTHLGLFFNEDEAALKYNEVAKFHYGEFANLNIIKNLSPHNPI